MNEAYLRQLIHQIAEYGDPDRVEEHAIVSSVKRWVGDAREQGGGGGRRRSGPLSAPVHPHPALAGRF